MQVLISLVHLRQRSEDFQKDPALLAQILAAETTKTPPSGGSLAAGGRQSSIGRALSPVPYNKPTSALSPEPVQKQSPQPDKSKGTNCIPAIRTYLIIAISYYGAISSKFRCGCCAKRRYVSSHS